MLRIILFLGILSGGFNISLLAQESISGTNRGVMIIDSQHYSHVFSDVRKYRIFLPPNYGTDKQRRYPVIYFFHGWAQRYFGEMDDGYSDYDKGDDNDGDNIAAFVATRDVIIVKIDGLNQFASENLNLTPYNIGTVSTFRQFPIYFQEFVQYIDATYLSIPDRSQRAVSGLSMGGFMSYWISGKYPDLVSAVGNFCGSLEMAVGPPEFPITYNHIPMYDNYAGVNMRFHYGTKDRLRYYHYDINKIWPQVMNNYEYHVYDAGHVTCGMGDMFEFIFETFNNPPAKPVKWDHIDVYPNFSIWDYDVITDRMQPGFTILENVNNRGFKSAVRTFLPEGEFMSHVKARIVTAPVYLPSHKYAIIDFNKRTNQTLKDTLESDALGRLSFLLNGDEHHIGINKMDDISNVSISAVKVKNMSWAITNKDVAISVSLINKGMKEARNLKLNLIPIRDYVKVKNSEASIAKLNAGEIKPATSDFIVFIANDSIEMARFRLVVEDQAGNEWMEDFELKFRRQEDRIEDFIIADGGLYTVVEGGVDSVTGIVGKGNGDGIANPGETIMLLVPYKGKLYRTNAYSSDDHLNPDGVQIQLIDSWAKYDFIGGGPRYTMPVVAADCPSGKWIDFWVEFWLPKSPEHIIRRGNIQIKIGGGRDATPPVFKWLQVLNDRTFEVKVADASKVGRVYLKLVPDKESSTHRYLDWEEPEEFSVELTDRGLNGDKCAGDHVFSLKIAGKSAYFYHAEITMEDEFGNEATYQYPKPVLLQDTN